MKNILFVGELPPKTIHGVSNSNAMNIKILSEYFNISVIEEYMPLSGHNKTSLSKIKQILSILKQIKQVIKQIDFSILYANMAMSYFGMLKNILYLITFKQKSKGEAIFHIHRGDFESFYNHSFLSKRLVDFFTKRVDKLIFLSKTLVPTHLKESEKVYYLANTIIPENQCTIELNNKKRFLYLSNYITEKGIVDLLRVFKTIKNDELLLNCYGSFVNKKLEEQIKSYQTPFIHINNTLVEKKFEVIQEADVLVLPSYNEGQPLTILEAMMNGTIVIATNVGDIQNMLGNTYPFLFKARDVKGLEDAITKFLKTSAQELYELSVYLQKRYFTKYSNKQHKKELLKIFNYENNYHYGYL